jgi:serine/threonine-protein kinase
MRTRTSSYIATSSRLLVTNDGVPRLLDFGIAKLLGDGTTASEQTRIGVRPLTPEYASPEQIRGEPVTTVSDIYSLGVLLYWLLAGQRPYRSAMSSPAEIEAAICHREPDKPSSRAPQKACQQITGDLDTITLMALRKEPRRRYASVEQFSEDIRRHLVHLPVTAQTDTWKYRATKFAQRNKAWVAMAAVTLFSLTGGIAVSLWQTHAARKERDVARVAQEKSARINAFLQEMVGYSGVTASTPNHNAHDATVADMLDDAAQRVETELADQPEVKAEMLGTIGSTYSVQAKYERAAHYLDKAYDLDLKLYGRNARPTASVMGMLGDLAYLLGDYAASDSWFQKAVPIYRKHVNDADFDVHSMAAMLSDAAFAKRALGRLDDAEALWQETLSYAPRLPAKYRAQGMTPKTFLAQLYVDRGDVAKADPMASEASRELREFGGDRVSLAQALIDLGNVRRLQARYTEADAAIEEGTNLFAQVLGRDHPNVAYGLISLANSRYYQAKYGAAEQDVRKALQIVDKLSTRTHYHESAHITLGLILSKASRAGQAEPLLRQALAIAQEQSRRPLDVALASGALGECLAVQRRFSEAEPLLTQSYRMLQALQIPSSPSINEARDRLASLYAAWGKPSAIAY